MNAVTSWLAFAGANSSWGFNQSTISNPGGTGSVSTGVLSTGWSGPSAPATITAGPSVVPLRNESLAPSASNSTQFANDTLCWLSYWSYTEAAASFTKWHRETQATTITRVSTISYTTPAVASTGNQSYTVLCDGLPRFGTGEEAQAAFKPVPLPTPVVTTTYITTSVLVAPTYTEVAPRCSIKDQAACSNLWGLYASSRSRSLSSWSSSNVLTISLASPPTSVVVNGETTSLPAADGALPVVNLHGTSYIPDQSVYSISNATSLTGRATLTPGGQGIFTWNGNDITALAYGPRGENCNGPPSGKIDSSQCAAAPCTIAATHVQLMYFPPPSKSRDLCANTSPGFDRFSVSIYSQPHVSTVINSTTYWQDKAYLRYSAISAYKTCSMDNLIQATKLPVGGVHSDQIVELASSDVSSICSWRMNPALHVDPIGATAFPFNFDDLNGPIPASAYTCIPQCLAGCSSIVAENWLTGLGLAVPSQIRQIDPAWASCVPYFLGVPDPPIALHSASNFLSTTDAPLKPTQPAPGTSPQPVVTATSDARPTRNPGSSSRPGAPNDSNPAQSDRPSNVDPPNNETPNGPAPTRGPIAVPTRVTFTRTVAIPQETDTAVGNRPATPIATVGGTPVFVDPSNPIAIVVGNPESTGLPTVSIGGPPLVVSGTTISLAPTGAALVISDQGTLVPLGIVGDQMVWTDPARPGMVLIGSPNAAAQMQTVSAGQGTAIISGTTVSLALPTGSESSSRVAMSIMGLSLVLDPATGTLKVNDEYVLQPGNAQITVNGHAVLFDPSGESVSVDGISYPLASLPLLVVGHNGITSTNTLRFDVTDSAASASTTRESSNAPPGFTSTATSGEGSSSNLNRPAKPSTGDTSDDTSEGSAVAGFRVPYWLFCSVLLFLMVCT